MRKVKAVVATRPPKKSRGSLPRAFSFHDAGASIMHGVVTCLGLVPVAFISAEQHVLHATFIAALGGGLGAVAKAVQRYFSNTR